MKYNPFTSPQKRKAILTFDNGYKVRAYILIPSDKPTWHAELEKRLVSDINRSQPHAVHKVVKIHILRN